MPYNPYQYYPYNAFNASNTFQPMQSVGPAIQSVGNGIIWVSGIAEAQNYPIAPNNAITLWDKTGTTVYVKQADATGRPSMKIYDLVERTEMPSESVSAPQDKLPSYATKSELGKVLDTIDGFDDAITSIRADIDAIKADISKKRRRADDE